MIAKHRGRRVCRRVMWGLLGYGLNTLYGASAWAQDDTPGGDSAGVNWGTSFPVILGWSIALVGSIVALAVAYKFYNWMMEQDEGDAKMVEIAGHVLAGANAYLWRQYRVVFIFFVVTSILLGIVAMMGAQSYWVPFAFWTGGFFSGLAGWFGMKTATWASSRTRKPASSR